MKHAPKIIVLAAVVLFAVSAFYGISFGLPDKVRPDEEFIVSRALSCNYGDFNPHFFQYPTLYYYFMALVYFLLAKAGAVLHAFPEGDFSAHVVATSYAFAHLWARYATALVGLCGILCTYQLGKKLYGSEEGAAAALFTALNFLYVQQAHYATTDIPMTVLSVLALTAMVSLNSRPALLFYLLSGTLAGLAASTKYPAVILLVPFFTAHLLAIARTRFKAWLAWGSAKFAAGVLFCVVFFFIGTPYLVLEWPKPIPDLQWHMQMSREGLVNSNIPQGFAWLFTLAAPYGLGILASFAAFFGLILAAVEVVSLRKRENLILLCYVASLLTVLLLSRRSFLRYFLPLVPVLAVYTAHFLRAACSRLVGSKNQVLAASISAVLLVSFPGIRRTMRTNELLSRMDTRTSARIWMTEHLPAGTAIVTNTAYWYAKPELPPGGSWAPLQVLLEREQGKRYVLLDEHPIRFFSPEPPAWTKQLLANKGRLLAEFTPFTKAENVAPVFEQADAYYVPLDGFDAVSAPGPILRLWEVTLP